MTTTRWQPSPADCARLFRLSLIIACLAQFLLLDMAVAEEADLIAGQNINMVSGTRWPGGDPFLQRQNEPTIAVSTRNDFNLMAGSNDYRTVDLPGLRDGKTIGDSWISVYRSNTGGGRWTSTLLPGYPQDPTTLGQYSPLWLAGYEASADPVIRAGTHGLFFYTGIAFTRAEQPPSAGFVATYMDLNNDERKSSIGYVRTTLFDQNTDGLSFIDKPWIAVDKPRGSAQVATLDVHTDDGDVVQQTVECGNVYVAYARIQGDGTAAISSQIMFVRSEDCGATWTEPLQVSLPNTINQGAAIAVDPLSGDVQIAWRQFENATLNCTRGEEFWRGDADAWPVNEIEIGGITYESGDTASIFPGGQQKGGTPWLVLRQLLSSWLNVLSGADRSEIIDAMSDAEAWLVEYPPGSKPKEDDKQTGDNLRRILRDFNQGKTGPAGCDGLADVGMSGMNPDAIMVTRSSNSGDTFSTPTTASGTNYLPFEQGTTPYSFRTTGFPTMTYDGSGRSYIAYATRGLAVPDNDPIGGDSRIVVTTSNDGSNWTPPRAIDEPSRPGHQFEPAFTFSRGNVFLLYYDMREDIAGVFDRFIVDLQVDPMVPRHSTDVRVARAVAADVPIFTDYSVLDTLPSTQASRYPFLLLGDGIDAVRHQMKYNPPNLPMFKGGTVPFFGDYIDLAALMFVKDSNGSWQYDFEAATGTPVVHAVWTDNRDVIGPTDGDWTTYVAPAYDEDGDGIPDPERQSIFDSDQPVEACDPLANPTAVDRTKMRNQNVYTSRLTQGLAAAIPGNNRPLGMIQRVFVGFVQNTTEEDRLFRLAILNQPAGGSASFDQFSLVTQVDEVVNPQSSISRSIFVSSSDPSAAVNIRVFEVDVGGNPLPDGLATTLWINSDETAPSPEAGNILNEENYTPAIFNPAIFNPAIFNQGLLGDDPDVGIYSPAIFNNPQYAEFALAALQQMALLNPAIFNPAIFNPAIFNPAIFNPAIFNPAIFNPAIFNPAIFNPAIFNPAIFNPAIFNPAIFNPAIFNPAIFNSTLVETSVLVSNTGNSTAAYSVNLDLDEPPEGFLYQLMVFRTYLTPVADGCSVKEEVVQEALVNEFAPDVNGSLLSPDSTSFYVAPGDNVIVSLRIVPDPDAAVPGDPSTIDTLDELQLSQSVVPQAVDTGGLAGGETEPTPVIVYAPGAAPVGTLVDADWHAPGDSLITFDSATDLEWLDLTVTTDMSVAEVSANLVLGGQFEGFSYATADQVAQFYTNAGLSGYATAFATVSGNSDPLQLAAVASVQNLWGITQQSATLDRSLGFIGEQAPGGSAYILATLGTTGSSWAGGTRGSSGNSDGDPGWGSALVRSAAFSGPPIGTLSEADWQVPRDGRITFDSATGLEWLNVNVTTNMSVTEVTAELGTGGLFEGFRYATAAEVEQMFTNAGLSGFGTAATGTIQGNTDPTLQSVAESLQGLLGLTCISGLPGCVYNTTGGYIGDPSVVGFYYFARLNVSPPGWGAGTTGTWTIDGAAVSDVGSMLVRP